MEIDLEGLREYFWEYLDGSLKDYITEDQHDKIRWIDTSTMICDPLTKAGGPNFAQRLIEQQHSRSQNACGGVACGGEHVEALEVQRVGRAADACSADSLHLPRLHVLA